MILLHFPVYVAAGDYLIVDSGYHQVQRCASSSLTSQCETVAGTGVVDASLGTRVSHIVTRQPMFLFVSFFSTQKTTTRETTRHEVASAWNSTAVTTSWLPMGTTTEFRCALLHHLDRHARQ